MKKIVFSLLFVTSGYLNTLQTLRAAANTSNSQAIFQPDLALPPVLTPIIDPAFNNPITRLTNARSQNIEGIIPDYSKRQAFNVDESLFILKTGDGRTLLYNAKTYQMIKELENVAGEDVFWHPTNAALIYFSVDNVLKTKNVVNDQEKNIFTFKGFTWANTRAEGNLSRDGKYYAVVGQKYNETTGDVKFKSLILLDLTQQKIVANLALPNKVEAFDWVSVSPLGNYIVVDYADDVKKRFHGLEVYDTKFNFIWQKPLGAGHSDLGVDSNGKEFLLMDVYDANRNLTVFKKFDLATGQETELLALAPLFDQHISCRATSPQTAGYCLISTFDYVERLEDSKDNWLPFEDEIFALSVMQPQSVKRIAHHRSRRYSPSTPDSDRSVYFSEPHATMSPKGDRILFGSNWRLQVEDTKSVDTYLLQTEWWK